MARSSRFASLLLFLVGCASAPSPGNSVSLNQAALEAYQRGDFERAASGFSKLMKIHSEANNADGFALNGLNLARVQQAAGDAEAAQRTLDRIANSEAAPGLRAEAAGRKAQLHLAGGERKEAADWQARAQALCGGCRAQAAILNIGARIALAAGNSAAAGELAGRVLKLPPSDDARAEQANAQRIISEAAALPRLAQPAQIQ